MYVWWQMEQGKSDESRPARSAIMTNYGPTDVFSVPQYYKKYSVFRCDEYIGLYSPTAKTLQRQGTATLASPEILPRRNNGLTKKYYGVIREGS